MHAQGLHTPLISLGQPQFGRLAAAPSVINWQDFDYQSPYGRSITGLRKRLAYKQFQFVSINHQHLMVGVALVDLTWAGHGFFYVHDQLTGQTFEISFINPLAHHTRLDLTPDHGESTISHRGWCLSMRKEHGQRHVRVTYRGQLHLDAVLAEQSSQPLHLCTPTAANGWTYTQKNTTLAVSGLLYWQNQWIDLSQAGWLGATDDSCGFLRRDTAWHWLSVSAMRQGVRIGLNLANGVNETFGTENTLWVEGQPYELPPVLFEQQSEQLWLIRSADERVRLQVETGWCRQESINAGIVGSHFHQWVGRISGQINAPEGRSWSFDGQTGLVEKHFARW